MSPLRRNGFIAALGLLAWLVVIVAWVLAHALFGVPVPW